MQGAVYIIVCIIILFINAFAATKMQEIAEQKGSKERYWAWCFWVPMAGYAMVIALPDRGKEAESRTGAKRKSKEGFVYSAKTSSIDDDLDYYDELPNL